jgi:hypothetical protein
MDQYPLHLYQDKEVLILLVPSIGKSSKSFAKSMM